MNKNKLEFKKGDFMRINFIFGQQKTTILTTTATKTLQIPKEGMIMNF